MASYYLFKGVWNSIDCRAVAQDSQQRWLEDIPNQVVGSDAGIIHYKEWSTNDNVYYHFWVIYCTQALAGYSLPPKTGLFRTDNWNMVAGFTGSDTTTLLDGSTYYIYIFRGLSQNPATNKWYFNTYEMTDVTVDGVISGTTAPFVIYDIGDKTGSSMVDIYDEGLRYLLYGPSSGHGQGTVTLDIPANGQALKFSSSLLGKTISQFISGDAEVNFDGETVGITLEGGKG